jgi:hypothetical protein
MTNSDETTMTAETRTRIGAIGVLGGGIGVALIIVAWLERAYAPGVGWLWLALTVALGGIGVDLLQRFHGRGQVCAPGPRPSPLQVSCLALQAVGVILFQSAQSAPFQVALPLLSAAWLPLACVVAGALGLGVLSVVGTCRDADLAGRV